MHGGRRSQPTPTHGGRGLSREVAPNEISPQYSHLPARDILKWTAEDSECHPQPPPPPGSPSNRLRRPGPRALAPPGGGACEGRGVVPGEAPGARRPPRGVWLEARVSKGRSPPQVGHGDRTGKPETPIRHPIRPIPWAAAAPLAAACTPRGRRGRYGRSGSVPGAGPGGRRVGRHFRWMSITIPVDGIRNHRRTYKRVAVAVVWEMRKIWLGVA